MEGGEGVMIGLDRVLGGGTPADVEAKLRNELTDDQLSRSG